MNFTKLFLIDLYLLFADASRLSSLNRQECDYALELLCLQDGSSSFLAHVEKWAETSNELLTRLREEYAEHKIAISSFTDKPIPFSGYGNYGGYSSYAQDYCYMNHVPFTTDPVAVANALQDLQSSMAAGFDWQEAQAEAMIYAALDSQVGWSPSSQVYTESGRPIARVILMITDAPSHEAGDAKKNLQSYNEPRSYPNGYDQPSTGGFGAHSFISSPALAVDEQLYYEMADLFALSDAFEAGVGEPLTEEQTARLADLVSMYGPEIIPEPIEHPGDNSITDCTRTEYPTLDQMILALKEQDILPIFLSSTPEAYDFYAWYQTNVFEPMGVLTINAMFETEDLYEDIMTAIDTLLAQKCLLPPVTTAEPTINPPLGTEPSVVIASEPNGEYSKPSQRPEVTSEAETTMTGEASNNKTADITFVPTYGTGSGEPSVPAHVSEAVTEAETEFMWDCTTKPVTKPVSEAETIVVGDWTTKPVTKPVTEAETEFIWIDYLTKPVTKPVTEAETIVAGDCTTKPVTKPVTEAETEFMWDCTTKPVTRPVTEAETEFIWIDYLTNTTEQPGGALDSSTEDKISSVSGDLQTHLSRSSLVSEPVTSEPRPTRPSEPLTNAEEPSLPHTGVASEDYHSATSESDHSRASVEASNAVSEESEVAQRSTGLPHTDLVTAPPHYSSFETEEASWDERPSVQPTISATAQVTNNEKFTMPGPHNENTTEAESTEGGAAAGGSNVAVIAGASAGAVAGVAAVAGLLYKQFGASLLGSGQPEFANVEQMATEESPVERETMQHVTMDLFQ